MPTLLDNLRDSIRLIGAQNLPAVLTYPLHKAWAEVRSGPAVAPHFLHTHSIWPLSWQKPGPIQGFTPHARGLTLGTANSNIEITLLAADAVQVRCLPTQHRPAPPLPYALAQPLDTWPIPPFEILPQGDAVFLLTGELAIGALLKSGALLFADAAGRLLRADIDMGWGRDGAVRHRTLLHEDERLFGLGERATPWNRRGGTHILWNQDPAGYKDGDDPINLNIPVYVSVRPGDGPAYLIFYENTHYAEFDLGAGSPQAADHRFADGELRYVFIAGAVPTLLERYTELTGRHALPPLWMLGYQQSRWSYYPEARVRQLAQDFREHEIPCDAIHLDIDYMDGFRVFTWDKNRFPDLPALAADLRAQGIKLITIVDPGVKADPAYAVYRSGKAGGHFCTLPTGEIVHAPVWPGNSAFPDFTDPQARAWWGEQYRPLVEAGVAGFWNDMNEPATFSPTGPTTLPATTRHSLEGRGGDHREAHNLYGMLMARASAEGVLALRPDLRPVVITRAGWAGVQRYATSWTGDNQSTWESLRLTLPLVLGLGLSGVGFTGPDIGGFAGAADGELFTRWLQQATFMPFYRAHTSLGTPDQEPWSYGEPYLSINRRFIQLRYELLPYLYTAVWQMATRGWPMVRPLGWLDRALWDVDDAFLCGDALFVAPVMEPGITSRKVRLPAGTWYEFWTNQRCRGGEALTVYAPLETTPLFVREGTVLPLGEIGPSVEQRPDRFLRLHLYPLAEAGEATSWLYEDAGEGFGYQQGERRVSRFVMQRDDTHLHVAWEREGTFEPPYVHIALTLNGLRRAPQEVRADGDVYPIVVSDPVQRTALLSVPPFTELDVQL
ncbi:MAG: Alpha-xylosidase [Chloroflexi bacterium ADurb.Bin222]|nr:MAG: Alpha-xylosidase [Chloroflexi bacterium ADurb.Bin222]